MAPRTAPVSSPGSPPKRMTRARAARNAEVSDTPDTALPKGTRAADKTAAAAPTRGRPRTKTADIPTAATPALGQKATDATSNADAVCLKKQPAKRGRKKVQVEAQDIFGADDDSSDDEMDIVTVKIKHKMVSSSKTASVSKGSVGRSRKAVQVPKEKSHAESWNANDDDDNDDDDDEDELAQAKLPKHRPGRPKSTSTVKMNKSVSGKGSGKAPVGRPRKATTVTADNGNTGTSKTIHISAASLTASSAASKPRTNVAAAPRKKVTFLDMAADSDKENQPIPASTAPESKEKIKIGIKAKPVRKTTPAFGGKRSTRGAQEGRMKEPLSPKKATQVARSGSSASSADEVEDSDLGSPRPGVTRQTGPLTKRDARRPFDFPVKKIDFVSPTKPSSQAPSVPQGAQNEQRLFSRPIQDAIPADSIMLSSPARKLPPSPYKDSMRDSPRRAQLQPAALMSYMEIADRREYSPLKISPKKGNIGASFCQSPFKSTATPSKGKPILLQSPAKRPPSPIKSLPSRTIGQETPARGAVSASPEEKKTFLHNVKPSLALGEQQEFASKLFDHDIKEETNSDDVFVDYPFDFEMGIFEEGQPEAEVKNDICHPIVEEPIDDESPLKTPIQELDDQLFITEVTSTPPSSGNVYETVSQDASVSSTKSSICIPPAAPSPPVFTIKDPARLVYRDDMLEDSEDELMADVSPSKFNAAQSRRETLFGGAVESHMAGVDERPEGKMGFTPLAERLSKWGSISPVKRRSSRVQGRGVFSPLKPSEPDTQDCVKNNELENVPQPLAVRLSISAGITVPSYFEDEMITHHCESMDSAIVPGDLDGETTRENGISATDRLNDGDALDIPPEIHDEAEEDDDETFGDENAVPSESTIPIDSRLFDETVGVITKNPIEKEDSIPLPMSVTPVRSGVFPRTIHTVSKVPLRHDGDASMLHVPRKRSRSLSSSHRKNSNLQLGKGKFLTTPSPRKVRTSIKPSGGDFAESETESEQLIEATAKYSTSTWLRPAGNSAKKSPNKSKPQNEKVLQGAVVFADVHTAEGADASGIFVELLTQMGARCVKSWSWNPRASLSPVDGTDPKDGKVGITHVVFKDGGVRTLEKVREAGGVVKCVGVGWVLDCERKGKWLDEINYGVDVSLVPRGGQKRRKSMEPRALSNMNGSIIKLDSSISSNGGRRSVTDRETFQELMRLSPTPPSSRRESMEWEKDPGTSQPEEQLHQHFATQSTPTNPSRSTAFSLNSAVQSPTTPDFNYAFDFDGASAPSPITPYYPSQGTQLTQQTCPPKQLRQGLFDNSGRGDAQISEGLRMRLEAARRRSLVWKPKVGSPLGRPGLKF
ncbi:hypothetical protein AJ78_06349 [Emergomyces pasteurianus Ep9510]|uniref:BRCT domain-containing protein n=1 Tax=Emergomyces pasteurianus Ep9510 TaxID=1447872 RepID=A0A1J9QDB1_9EURO|nr:hypothetical protein AJ78_06349 [Emergomyces pasteurianus Ep9510]